MGIFRDFATPHHPNWLIVESNNMIVAEEAIRIAEKCDVKKCKIIVKYYDGNADRFAVVKRIKP